MAGRGGIRAVCSLYDLKGSARLSGFGVRNYHSPCHPHCVVDGRQICSRKPSGSSAIHRLINAHFQPLTSGPTGLCFRPLPADCRRRLSWLERTGAWAGCNGSAKVLIGPALTPRPDGRRLRAYMLYLRRHSPQSPAPSSEADPPGICCRWGAVARAVVGRSSGCGGRSQARRGVPCRGDQRGPGRSASWRQRRDRLVTGRRGRIRPG